MIKISKQDIVKAGSHQLHQRVSLVVLGILSLTALTMIALTYHLSTFPQRTLAAKGDSTLGTNSHTNNLTLTANDPYAKAQPTSIGKTIWTLTTYNNKLYPGFGDWQNNTGPIQIAPYDPTTGTFTLEFTSQTQAIENYRILGGQLYAPSIDGHLLHSDYASGLPWANYMPVTTWHAFDMASFDGQDLWLAGSVSQTATAWRSTDGGTTWEVVRQYSSGGAAPQRYYFIGNYNGKIYLQAGSGQKTSEVFDGTTWTTGPNLLPTSTSTGFRPVEFAGKMVYLDTHTPGVIDVFDGTTARKLANTSIVAFSVDGNYLYGITSAGQVSRTTDLTTWVSLGGGGLARNETAKSVAILNNVAYVGTSNSNIYKLTLP